MSTAKYSHNSNETVNKKQKNGTMFQVKDDMFMEQYVMLTLRLFDFIHLIKKHEKFTLDIPQLKTS